MALLSLLLADCERGFSVSRVEHVGLIAHTHGIISRVILTIVQSCLVTVIIVVTPLSISSNIIMQLAFLNATGTRRRLAMLC